MEQSRTQPQRAYGALRLRYRNPIAFVLSPAPWTAAAFLFSSLFVTSVWFATALAALLIGAVLSLTWVGLPVLFGALAAVHGLATVERWRAGHTLGLRIAAPPRPAPASGIPRRLAQRLRTGQTWREIVLLVVAFPFLFVIDLLGLVAWLVPITLISLPFWYRYSRQTFDNGTTGHGVALGYYPDGPHGTRRYGWFVDDQHSALIAAGVGVVLLVLVGSYAAVAAARTHARVIIAQSSPDAR